MRPIEYSLLWGIALISACGSATESTEGASQAGERQAAAMHTGAVAGGDVPATADEAGSTNGGAGGADDDGAPARPDAATDPAMTDDGIVHVVDDGDAGTHAPAASSDAGIIEPIDPSWAHCLRDITDFGPSGPFESTAMQDGKVRIWMPQTPADCRVPVVHYSTGTGAPCSLYLPTIEGLASHGFIVACYDGGRTGSGVEGATALARVFELLPQRANRMVGTVGHETGGQGAFTTLQQAEERWGASHRFAGLAVHPASGFGSQPDEGPWRESYAKIRSPMFMFSGQPGLVSERWVGDSFDALDDSVEAYHWSEIDSSTIEVPQSETLQVAIPWFRWKLLDDDAACRAFKALLDGDDWVAISEQNAQDC